MREQLFHLRPDSGASLQGQLREMVVSAILDGHIPPGAALPSCRRLARQLGVARNTVVLAFAHLVDEGYLVARERSGYFVSKDILSGRVSTTDSATSRGETEAPESGGARPDWTERLAMYPSRQRNIVKRPNWQRYRFPFVYGQFDTSLFPIAEWRECARQALGVDAIRGWASDRIDTDDPALIEQLRTRVLPRRGVWADESEILVTVGAQQAVYLLARLLLSPGTRVGIEEPGYPDARNTFALHTDAIEPIPIDTEGMVVDERLDRCRCVYVTPSHQHPTTVTMTIERRRALLERAAAADCVIIEDDYESEFNYIGSLSKTLAPGLRLGYMVGPRELITEARALRRLILRHPPANNQHAVALFLSLGHHDALVRRLRHAYEARWMLMGEALRREVPDSTRIPTFGGTSFWVSGPAGLDVRVLEPRAAAEGILVENGDVHFLAEPPPRNHLRLGFSSVPAERIDEGVTRLAALIRTCAADASDL